jgi:ABC-type branched-subunit amino acid transport system substrate-binding protein
VIVNLTVQPIAALDPDAYVLAALPSSASSLIFALTAVGTIEHPSQWYLSPTLHTPALLANIPKGALDGAHGVAAGTAAGAQDFSTLFQERWHDQPLDDAYPFYDAGAVAVLALEHALARTQSIPRGSEIAPHVRAVTQTSGTPVAWNELARGIELLRAGQEIGYVGLSGPIDFDLTGQTPTANTNWWTIGPAGFANVANASGCK